MGIEELTKEMLIKFEIGLLGHVLVLVHSSRMIDFDELNINRPVLSLSDLEALVQKHLLTNVVIVKGDSLIDFKDQ